MRDLFDNQMELMDQLHDQGLPLFANSAPTTIEPRKPIITWANITCGEDCWNAVCIDCKCSCGGVNHGIYRRTGQRPDRTCREGVTRYKLAAVVHFAGSIRLQNKFNDYFTDIAKVGPLAYVSTQGKGNVHVGYKTKLKCCSPSQLKWPEFQNAVTPANWSSKQEKCDENTRSMFYGLWIEDSATPSEIAAGMQYANEQLSL